MPEKIPKAVAKLVVALATLHAMGEERPSKEMVGNQAGVSHKTSTMRNACAAMKKLELADTSDPKTLLLLPKGHDLARTLDDIQLPTSNDEFHERFKASLLKEKSGKKAIQIFDLLLENVKPMSKEEIGKGINADVKTSTFRNAMAPLNKHGLMEKLDTGKYQLTDKCFPMGRP